MKVENFLIEKKDLNLEVLPTGMDSEQTLILCFFSPSLSENSEIFKELKSKFPLSNICGCSTAGEIHQDLISDDSLSISITQFDSSRVQLSEVNLDDFPTNLKAGEQLAKNLLDDGLRGVFILSEGINVNGTEIVNGLKEVLPKDIILTGGLSGDGSNFTKTSTLFQGELKSKTLVGVGFYGPNINLFHGTGGGWDIFGPERRITRSDHNVLQELDGRPALDLYKEYLGERASELPAAALLFPLSIRENADSDKKFVRTILGIDEEKKSMTFAGDLPTGYLAQLMRANFERLIDGASIAAEKIDGLNSDSPTLSIAISCVGRRLVLGERADEEVEVVLESLPKESNQTGFYSYGELCPQTVGGECDLHNQTMTLTIIQESNG